MKKSVRKSRQNRKSMKKSVRKSRQNRKSMKKSVRKSRQNRKSMKKSSRKSIGKSPKETFSILVKPELFDNKTINANTEKSRKLAVSHLDKVKTWFKKHAKLPIEGAAKVVKIEIEGNNLRFIFDKRPTAGMDNYYDPDDDGNHPVIIDGKKMLISGKIVSK